LRRRFVGLLLLPVLTLIFIIGWFMYFVGDKNENNRKPQITKDQNIVKTKNSVITEIGLVEELTEEDQTKQQEQ
jgi:uncharacterized membrane protein YGL010W